MTDQSPPVILHCAGLEVTYPNGGRGLRGVDLLVRSGERIALVGESGCGKSTLVRAVLGLLPSGTRVDGSIVIDQHDMVGATERRLRPLRGQLVGYVPQNPANAFDPLRSVGSQLREAWVCHGRAISHGDLVTLLAAVGVEGANELVSRRPSAWSGGMLQRAAIVAATALQPPIVLADEPTSALDRPLARQMLAVLAERSRSSVIVTHDVDLTEGVVDRVIVMYAGKVVEDVPAIRFFRRPNHPYSRALMAAMCRPGQLPQELPGEPPDGRLDIEGCAFAPRCAMRQPACQLAPPMVAGTACHFVEQLAS